MQTQLAGFALLIVLTGCASSNQMPSADAESTSPNSVALAAVGDKEEEGRWTVIPLAATQVREFVVVRWMIVAHDKQLRERDFSGSSSYLSWGGAWLRTGQGELRKWSPGRGESDRGMNITTKTTFLEFEAKRDTYVVFESTYEFTKDGKHKADPGTLAGELLVISASADEAVTGGGQRGGIVRNKITIERSPF